MCHVENYDQHDALQYLIPVDLGTERSINSQQGSMAIMVNPCPHYDTTTTKTSMFHNWRHDDYDVDRFWNVHLLGKLRSEIHRENEMFSTVHVSIEYVPDTTEIVQRDDVSWKRYVENALLEDQTGVDD